MPYDAEISRRKPSLFVFLIDQSRSMSRKIAGGSRSKSQEAAYAINKQLNEIISRCTKSDGVRPYFYVGVIGYGIKSGEALSLIGDEPIPINELENHILRMETETQQIEDEEIETEFPIWFEPVAAYDTPMTKALTLAGEWIVDFIGKNPDSFPPILINISDGGATDGDPLVPAKDILDLETTNGKTLIWNCHISEKEGDTVKFPNDPENVGNDKHAVSMFNMSSQLPDTFIAIAREEFTDIPDSARAYVYNGDLDDLIKLLDIGTRVAYSKVS